MSKKQTIFFTINRAIIARNFFQNEFARLFSDAYNVVILTPLHEDPVMKKHFAQYTLEPLYARELSPFMRKVEQLFISMHKALIYNETTQVTSEYGLMLQGDVPFKKFRNWVEKHIFARLAYRPVRTFVKWVDRKLFPCARYNDLFDKYNPVAVFSASLGSDDEIALVRNAKDKGIPTMGMAQSWDNLSKYGFREKVDLFIVWSEFMQEEALAFQDYTADELACVGIPQFDHYANPDIPSREAFCKQFNLDPNKKIILFGGEGPMCPDDPYVVSVIQEKIKDGTLAGYQVLVRPHFAYRNVVDRYYPLVDNVTVSIDDDFEATAFKDGTGLGMKSVDNLIAETCHAAVCITSCSTLVLDYAALGKRPLLYDFDKDKQAPYKRSMKRFYTTLWFREIRKVGVDMFAPSEEHLVEMVKDIAEHPDKEADLRDRLVERFCYKIDGKSGERLFHTVEQFISQQTQS